MQVTVKTLRHYESKGLLMPDEVDKWTGYRYYTLGQMQRLNAIRDLQRLGFSLDDIAELPEDDFHDPGIEGLDRKIEETDRQLKGLKERHARLLSWKNSRKTVIAMEKFSVQSLPAIIVASLREIIPDYSALGEMLCNKIGPEMHRLGFKCPPPGYCFTVDHGKEYTPSDIDIEYCEQVEEMGKDSSIIRFKSLPAVPKAICMKHIGPYERFCESYVELFKHIEDSGKYKICGQPRCCYVDGAWNQEDPEKWLSIIQVPVEES